MGTGTQFGTPWNHMTSQYDCCHSPTNASYAVMKQRPLLNLRVVLHFET